MSAKIKLRINRLRDIASRFEKDLIKADDSFIMQLFYPHLVCGAGRERKDEIIKYLRPRLVLDAGCGSGWLSLETRKRGFSVIAIDLSMKSIERAKTLFEIENVDIPLMRASLPYLPFKKDAFDSIICSEVIEHVPNVGLTFSEMHRVLKKLGRLCITTPNGYGSWGIIYDMIIPKLSRGAKGIEARHVHKFTPDYLQKMITENKFRILDFENLELLTSLYAWIICGIFKKDRPYIRRLEESDLKLAKFLPLRVGSCWTLICEKVQS